MGGGYAIALAPGRGFAAASSNYGGCPKEAEHHGFLNDHPPADRTPLLMVLNVVSGTRYHEPSAQDARRRIVEGMAPRGSGAAALGGALRGIDSTARPRLSAG